MKAFAKSTMTLKTGAVGVLFVAFCAVYAASLLMPPGWVTGAIALVALMFLVLTAIARVNDITGDTVRWHARRLGLLAVVGGCISVVLQLLQGRFPTWGEVMLLLGFMATWATTPNQPPWWQLMGEPDRRRVPRPVDPAS
jgi:hypothetical protein